MAVTIKVTQEFIGSINNAVHAWKRDPLLKAQHRYFDVMCEEEYGIKVDWSTAGNRVQVDGATILDEEKYINFLLRYGMPND